MNAISDAFSNTTVAGTNKKLYADPIHTGMSRNHSGIFSANKMRNTATVATPMVTISVTPHERRRAGAPAFPKLAASDEVAHCGLKM